MSDPVVRLPRVTSCCIHRKANAAEHPTARGWEEVPIRRASVIRRSDRRAASQHHLTRHELAVVLTDRAGGGMEPWIREVRTRSPLPRDVVELPKAFGSRRRCGVLPFELRRKSNAGPTCIRVGLVVTDVHNRL